MAKKNKDPFPITDIYHVTDTLVDGATVVVTDLCENLSNSINTHDQDIFDDLKKINTKKFNSISVSNGADGVYPVWVGVDKFNKVRKIFASTNSGSFYDWDRDGTKKLVSWSFNKRDLNDQYFFKSKDKKIKRKKLFDMKINSGAIAIADHGGNFWYEHYDALKEALDEKYYKIENIFQNNYPIGLFKFHYGDKEVSSPSSFKSSKIHDQKVVNLSDFRTTKYTEFLSNLLDESCYPTKYIFEKYFEEEKGYRDHIIELKIKDEKISANYLSERLPKALEILKKQNKILFGKNFKEVHNIRKVQFENFIISIIKDIEPQELTLPTFGKKEAKKQESKNKLTINKVGLPYIQDTFYDGYKLKSEPSLRESATIPVKNGKYPCYIHSYSQKEDDDDYEFNSIYVVVEGLENCYLNRNKRGELFFDKSYRESLAIREHINKKSNSISLDKIDLRNTDNLKELEKINFVESLVLTGFQEIENWNGLSKLKKLRKLSLVSCDINFTAAENFFKNLYSLPNLEELTIDDSSSIPIPNLSKFPKNLYFKKLKSYEISFRKDWTKLEHENYPNHKGYGGEKLWFLVSHLPNIYQFPNFEKFKSLEKLKIYNYFDYDQKEGHLFNYENGFEDYYQKINKLCKNSKIQDIWINGYSFKQPNELANTKYLDGVIKLINNTKVKLNGINQSTLNKISKKPISSSKQKINKIILLNKVEEIHDNKLLSLKDNIVTLNYFSILQDTENRTLLNDAFSQPIEELIIKPAYQFFRSELIYTDTFKAVEEFIEKNKTLKSLIIEFDEDILSDDYGDMAGLFGHEESGYFNRFILRIFNKNKKIKIILRHKDLKRNLDKTIDLEKYIKIFEMFRILDDSNDTKNRFKIENFNRKEIDKVVEKFLLEKVNSIIVIEDNWGWNESKFVRDIEFFDKFINFEDLDPFSINLEKINFSLTYEGDKNYPKESKFINEMFESEKFWRFSSDKFNHFLNGKHNYDEPIIVVKQKFLNNSKKVIFKNIKHYYYFCEPSYDFDAYDNINYNKFWKAKDKFKFPKSIKFNQLETLNIIGGREIDMTSLIKSIDSAKLKQMILSNCIGVNREIPYLPKLENLIIEDNYTEKSNGFSKFANLPNLENLELLSLYNKQENGHRWMTTEFDFTDIYKLSKLKYLKLDQINPEYLPPLKTLKNIEELEISLKLITGDMYSDEGTIDKNLIDENFDFLQSFKSLKKLKIDIPDDTSSVKGPKLLSFINNNLEELTLEISYFDENIKNGNNTIKHISKKFKILQKLKLIISRNEKFEENEKSNTTYFRKTGEKWEYNKDGPRPFELDLKIISRLKDLKQFGFRQKYNDEMGFKIINPISITKLKKLKTLNIKNGKFSSNDLEIINKLTTGKRDKFLEECKKKDKSISSEYSLPSKEKKKYDKLNKEFKFGEPYHDWGYDTIEEILAERKKKKNETAN